MCVFLSNWLVVYKVSPEDLTAWLLCGLLEEDDEVKEVQQSTPASEECDHLNQGPAPFPLSLKSQSYVRHLLAWQTPDKRAQMLLIPGSEVKYCRESCVWNGLLLCTGLFCFVLFFWGAFPFQNLLEPALWSRTRCYGNDFIWKQQQQQQPRKKLAVKFTGT